MKRRITEINSGSMADIAFLLLIFFLVTSTIDQDPKGIKTNLPPLAPVGVKSTHQLDILINSRDQILADLNLVENKDLSRIVYRTLARHGSKGTVISIKNDRETSYSAYVRVYDSVKRGYNLYRGEYCKEHFGTLYDNLSPSQKAEVEERIPLRVSEAEPAQKIP